MFSAEDPDAVLTALGDKFLTAFSASVTGAREDISTLREEHADWFPPMHSRTLSNIIHDRIWARLAASVDLDETVVFREYGSTREVQVGVNFLLRIKRHRAGDLISNYPTQTVLDFYLQSKQEAIDGLELITLAAGYRWDEDLRAILAPVLSYRDGMDNPIWVVEIDEPQAGATTPIGWRPLTGPELPQVEYGDEREHGETSSADE